jgi:stearoyl-CoA desaturase (Delta-9 desaturase)
MDWVLGMGQDLPAAFGHAPSSRTYKLQIRAYFSLLTVLGLAPAVFLASRFGVSALDVGLFAAMYLLTVLGMTLGWHRMLAHRTFKAHAVVKAFLLAAAGMANQGTPSSFVFDHLSHHARSDQAGDPHSPKDGLWHAHMGWFLDSSARPDAVQKYRKDPWVAYFDRTEWLWVVVGLLLPAFIGFAATGTFLGFVRGLVWGGFFRIVIAHHAVWTGGSLCHWFGTRPFDTADSSKNNLVVALVQFGEGWHNNHHALPWAANHREKFWQFDPQATLIRLFEKLGLVADVRWAKEQDWERARQRLNGSRLRAKPLPETLSPRSFLERAGIIFTVIVAPIFGLTVGALRIWAGKMTWLDGMLLVGMYVLSYLGLTLGYHRMLSHRAFNANAGVKFFLYAFAGMGAMANPSAFAAVHRVHHAKSDLPGDPHSPREGFFFAHYGWILSQQRMLLPRECAILVRDPWVKFFDDTHSFWSLMGLLLPFTLGGLIGGSWDAAWSGMIFGGLIRIFCMQQALFATASMNHTIGPKPFATPDLSRNSYWFINIFQLGDGYHNNHHALPWAANFNKDRRQFDLPGAFLRLCAALGWVHDARWAAPEDWQRRAQELRSKQSAAPLARPRRQLAKAG